MTKKYKHRIDTMEGPIEFESDVPPISTPSPRPPPITPEEEEAKRQRLYPDTSKASYLQYHCHYCENEFYLKSPYRAPNMNPLSEGFICIYHKNYDNYYHNNRNNKELGRLIPTCRSCFKEMENEPITIKPWLSG